MTSSHKRFNPLPPCHISGRLEAGCDEAGRGCLAGPVALVSPEEIDHINILNASIEAMHRALRMLDPQPGAVIVDGNRFKPYGSVECTTFVKGDGRFANIAAASVLAKTERDLYMMEAHKSYPEYCWDINKGYPTRAHRDAIEKYGTTPLHRMSFRLLAQPSIPGLE